MLFHLEKTNLAYNDKIPAVVYTHQIHRHLELIDMRAS
jgi:hypothetical protein